MSNNKILKNQILKINVIEKKTQVNSGYLD